MRPRGISELKEDDSHLIPSPLNSSLSLTSYHPLSFLRKTVWLQPYLGLEYLKLRNQVSSLADSWRPKSISISGHK